MAQGMTKLFMIHVCTVCGNNVFEKCIRSVDQVNVMKVIFCSVDNPYVIQADA